MKSPGYHHQEPDHGLPLVQLKEQRRELVIAFQRRTSPLTPAELTEIAAIQHAISAFEEVIGDIDAEPDSVAATENNLMLLSHSA
jgi:hypothetical protein